MALMRLCLPLLLALLWSAAAQAQPGALWLPGSPRAIAETDSASRDAPVLAWSYGPRAQASLGQALGLVAWDARRVRLGVSALLALEDANVHAAFPTEHLRHRLELSLAWLMPRLARAHLPLRSQAEMALTVGHDGPTGRMDSPDPIRPDDVPFGAGGNFVGLDLALRVPWGARTTASARVGARLYANAFALIAGRSASSMVADALHEGALCAATLDLSARYRWRPGAEPLIAVFGQWLVAHDASARDPRYLRALAGLGLPGKVGEWMPFGAVELGNGQGLLVNRQQLALSLGVRHAF